MLDVEIKNVYPVERNDERQFVKGGLHVVVTFAENVELNIRGILFSKDKQRWFFRMPFKQGICHKTGNSKNYPIVIFSDVKLNEFLVDSIYQKAPAVIENFLASNSQQVEETNPETIETEKSFKAGNTQSKNEKLSSAVPIHKKPIDIAGKQWVDPPKRPIVKNTSKFAKR